MPNQEHSILASTANELRKDKYTGVNPEKLKAAAEGLQHGRFLILFLLSLICCCCYSPFGIFVVVSKILMYVILKQLDRLDSVVWFVFKL